MESEISEDRDVISQSYPAGFMIVGLGETLFDQFSNRSILGGAPVNAAIHAHQLASVWGGQGVVATRIGVDSLSQRVITELARRGMSTHAVQRDVEHATGTVDVQLQGGEARYQFAADVAWDYLQWSPDLEYLAGQCRAVTFGTLAQRRQVSRETIHRYLNKAVQAVRLFDVNLRQSFFNRELLLHSCKLATHVKMNKDEWLVVSELLGETYSASDPAVSVQKWIRKINLRGAVLTDGCRGTTIIDHDRVIKGQPVSFSKTHDADSVGAGDACSAAILTGLVMEWDPERVVEIANRAGAAVASHPGATPILPRDVWT